MSENTTNTSKRKRGRPSLKNELDRSTVLEVAVEIFGEMGYEGAQQKIIADRLGVSNPLLSYHFKKKEDIWKQAIKQLGDKLVERFENIKVISKDLKGISLMKVYNRQLIYFFAENPAFYRIIFQEMGIESWRSNFLSEEILQPIFWFGEESVINASKPIEVKKIPPHNFGSIMVGSAAAFFMMAHHIQKQHGIDVFSKEEIDLHADVVNGLVFAQFEE